jgi:hypothetical protein
MSAGALDALFGIVQSDGDEVELGGGLNFTGGLAAAYNQGTGVIDVTLAASGEASIIDYDNAASGLAASNVQDAIDELAAWGWADVLENGASSGGHDVTIDADDAFIFERGAANARMVASVDLPGGIDLENDGGSSAGFLLVNGATRGAVYTFGGGTTLETETGVLLLNAPADIVHLTSDVGFDFESTTPGGPVVITVTVTAPVVTWTTDVGGTQLDVVGDFIVEASDDVGFDADADFWIEAVSNFDVTAAGGTHTYENDFFITALGEIGLDGDSGVTLSGGGTLLGTFTNSASGLQMAAGKRVAFGGVSTQYITSDASGMESHVPTGDTFEWFINSVSKLLIDTSLVTVGAAALAIGATVASTGAIRLVNNSAINFRNAANGGDISGVFTNGSDQLFLGWSGNPASTLIYSGTGFTIQMIPGGTAVGIWRTTELELASTMALDFAGDVLITDGGSAVITSDADALILARASGNVAFGADASAWNSMVRGTYIAQATANPAAAPLTGFYLYGDASTGRPTLWVAGDPSPIVLGEGL